MKTPAVTVYYDGEEQDFVYSSCDKSDGISRMKFTYNKQVGRDHVLKVNVNTGQRVFTTFAFGEKTFGVITCNPTFDGFYDKSTRRTKQFRLGDFEAIKEIVKNNPEQMEKLNNQEPVLNIVIKEWTDDRPTKEWTDDLPTTRFVSDGIRGGFSKFGSSHPISYPDGGGRRNRIMKDGGHDTTDGEDCFDGVETDGACKNKPVGYETNVLNKDTYVDAKGKEGAILAEIKLTFVTKNFINIV